MLDAIESFRVDVLRAQHEEIGYVDVVGEAHGQLR